MNEKNNEKFNQEIKLFFSILYKSPLMMDKEKMEKGKFKID